MTVTYAAESDDLVIILSCLLLNLETYFFSISILRILLLYLFLIHDKLRPVNNAGQHHM